MATGGRVVSGQSHRFPAWAAIVGGLLWSLFGVFEMLEPFGSSKNYVDSLGYELVTRPGLFQLYNLPGAVALALLALALIGVTKVLDVTYPGRRGLGFLVVGLALVSLAGTVALIAPIAVVGLSLGRLLLGVATLVAAFRMNRVSSLYSWTNALLPLGLGGVTLLALQPLTWALSWFSPALSTVIMVAFGLGWLALGTRVARSTDFDRTGMP